MCIALGNINPMYNEPLNWLKHKFSYETKFQCLHSMIQIKQSNSLQLYKYVTGKIFPKRFLKVKVHPGINHPLKTHLITCQQLP